MNTFANSLRLHQWQERYEDTGRSIDVRRHVVQTRVGLVWPVVKRDDGLLMMRGEKWPDEPVAGTYTVMVGCDDSNPDTRIDYL